MGTGSINSSKIKILLIIIVGLFFFPSAILLEAKFKKKNKENVPSLHGFYLERPIVAVSNIIKSGPPRGVNSGHYQASLYSGYKGSFFKSQRYGD